MIPSKRWFPLGLIERAAWFQNFAAQFAVVAASLGFKSADITQVENDNAVMQFLAELKNSFDAVEDAVRAFRKTITEHEVGKPTPAFPVWALPAPPVTVETGIFERLNRLVEKIRLADNYTDEIGALLGILPAAEGSISEGDLKPTIKAEASFAGFKFNAAVSKMGMPGFKIQIRRGGSETWTDAAFGTSSPLEVTVTPTAPGQPEKIQVRAILLKKNVPVGLPSDPTYVTLNP